MSNPAIAWLSQGDPPDAFPHPNTALSEPDGLLAAGADLSVDRLLYAYPRGIFAWYEEGQPVLWWSPDPRCVFEPGDFRFSRRLLREARQSDFRIQLNTAFAEVVGNCAAPRRHQRGTWITSDITSAFVALHELHWAHSIEVWHEDKLVGGLYGLLIGRAFFGESMFSGATNASKYALLFLDSQMRAGNIELLDCQVESPHLVSMGAHSISRQSFLKRLDTLCQDATPRRFVNHAAIRCADLLPN